MAGLSESSSDTTVRGDKPVSTRTFGVEVTVPVDVLQDIAPCGFAPWSAFRWDEHGSVRDVGMGPTKINGAFEGQSLVLTTLGTGGAKASDKIEIAPCHVGGFKMSPLPERKLTLTFTVSAELNKTQRAWLDAAREFGMVDLRFMEPMQADAFAPKTAAPAPIKGKKAEESDPLVDPRAFRDDPAVLDGTNTSALVQ